MVSGHWGFIIIKALCDNTDRAVGFPLSFLYDKPKITSHQSYEKAGSNEHVWPLELSQFGLFVIFRYELGQ